MKNMAGIPFPSNSYRHYLIAFVIQCLREEFCVCLALFFNIIAIYDPFPSTYLGRLIFLFLVFYFLILPHRKVYFCFLIFFFFAMNIPTILVYLFTLFSLFLFLLVIQERLIQLILYSSYFVSFHSTFLFLQISPEFRYFIFNFLNNLISYLSLLIGFFSLCFVQSIYISSFFQKSYVLAFYFLHIFFRGKSFFAICFYFEFLKIYSLHEFTVWFHRSHVLVLYLDFQYEKKSI